MIEQYKEFIEEIASKYDLADETVENLVKYLFLNSVLITEDSLLKVVSDERGELSLYTDWEIVYEEDACNYGDYISFKNKLFDIENSGDLLQELTRKHISAKAAYCKGVWF